MSKYRFKTEEEFKRDGLWNKDHPSNWNSSGKMNKYIGQDIPNEFNVYCDDKEPFNYESWRITHHDFILKKSQPEYTKGKWYKCERWGNDFAKLDYINDEQFYFIECIENKQHVIIKNWWSLVYSKLIEADMSIVSQFLPDGHPDKIVSETNVQESPDMIAIQEEAKRRFPIGCTFINHRGSGPLTLIQDHCTYKIEENKNIWANSDSGCLYADGKWATLVSLPESKKESIPEYVKCVTKLNHSTYGKIYKVISDTRCESDSPSITYLWGNSDYTTSTKEDYEAQFIKEEPIYTYLGDPLPTIKTKPLIEDVQSVSVNLRTKKKSIKF